MPRERDIAPAFIGDSYRKHRRAQPDSFRPQLFIISIDEPGGHVTFLYQFYPAITRGRGCALDGARNITDVLQGVRLVRFVVRE
ncbi:hypothetical protein KM043_008033 [Ampulex compressa]|nr:hypothetical protein KM043_008033 [Ampulex compressa]